MSGDYINIRCTGVQYRCTVHLYTPEEHYRGDAIEQDLGVEKNFVSAPIREGIGVIRLIHAI